MFGTFARHCLFGNLLTNTVQSYLGALRETETKINKNVMEPQGKMDYFVCSTNAHAQLANMARTKKHLNVPHGGNK